MPPSPSCSSRSKAFRFAARLKDARSIEVTYQIAPGYYLYRDKFKFSLAPQDAKPGTPQLPPGKKKKDEFFGEVETYRGDVSASWCRSSSPGDRARDHAHRGIAGLRGRRCVLRPARAEGAVAARRGGRARRRTRRMSELFGLKGSPAGR